MRIKCVIFDFDGTLADSKAIFLSVYNQIALKHNYRPIKTEGLHHLRTLTLKERCRYLGVPLYRIPFLAAEFLAGYKTELQQVKLFDGIKELLEKLNAEGLDIAIISSNAKSNILQLLADNAICWISKIYCSTNLFGKHKLITGFLDKYQLRPEDVLCVGDELRDIIACKKAGVEIAWVDWGYELKEVVINEEPDYVISHPLDIMHVIHGKS